jgi:hypothetical protein
LTAPESSDERWDCPDRTANAEPVRSLDQGWSMAKCGIRQSDAVFCPAESDLLVQNELSHFTIIYAWFKIPGNCSILLLETVELKTHVNGFGRLSYRSDGDHVHACLDVARKILSGNTAGHLDQETVSKFSCLK